MHPQTAAEEAIAFLEERRGGIGGLIVLDRLGRVGLAHNGDSFAVSVVIDGQTVVQTPVVVKNRKSLDDLSVSATVHEN